MLFNLTNKYFLPHLIRKIHLFRLTGGLFEDKIIVSCVFVGCQGVGEVGEILRRVIGSLFMVEHIDCKTCCFEKNRLGVRHGHICEDCNEAKYLWYLISLIVFLNCFASP